MKKGIALILALLCVALPCFSLTGCASAPAVEDIYDRVVELLESAYEINTVFYGPGLPVYKTDSKYAELNYTYYGFQYKGTYEYVTEYAKFGSEDEIMNAAKKIYSESFLNDVLAMAAFTGYATDNTSESAQYLRARYIEDEKWMYQSMADNTLYTAMRVYDYSTMRVFSLGRWEACKVVLNSWLEDSPEKTEEIEISLLFQDGQWYLDSFSGG